MGDSFMLLDAAMDSVDGAAMEITVDSVSIKAIAAGLGAYLEHPGTPWTKSSLRNVVSCKEHLNTILVLLGLLLIQFLHFYRQQVTQTSQIPKNI
jgi:hypothetical protein